MIFRSDVGRLDVERSVGDGVMKRKKRKDLMADEASFIDIKERVFLAAHDKFAPSYASSTPSNKA